MLKRCCTGLVGSMILLSSVGWAEESERIVALEQRIAALEGRLAALEQHLLDASQPRSAEEARAMRRAMFNKRMAQDRKKYSNDQLREAESLYQVANKDWSTQEAKDSLATMIEKYPDVNRTGCAVLYLGQMSQGAEREQYLLKAISDHADSMYGDGVIVGAYARLLLAQHYTASGEKEKARTLLIELQQKYPEAVNHNQMPLAPQIDVYMQELQ